MGLTNPQPTVAGEAIVLLDAAGQLRRFQMVPTRYSLADTIVEPDWQPLFALAGLDMANFTPDRPRCQRFMAPDRRRARVGTHADRPRVPMRIEAGSYEGRPVLFNVATVASMAALSAVPARQETTFFWILSSVMQPILIFLVVAGSVRVGIRKLVKRRIPALLLTLVVWTVLDGSSGAEGLIFSIISAVVMLVVLLRWGVVAMITCRMVYGLAWGARISDWSAWYTEAAVGSGRKQA